MTVALSRDVLGTLKLVAVAVIWGGTFIAGRVAVQTMDSWSAAFLRFAFAFACLLVAAWLVEGGLPRLSRRSLAGVAALGLTGILAYNWCFFEGLSRIPASRAALIIALNPIMVTLTSAFLFRQRIRPAQGIGILLSLAGAIVVVTHGDLRSLLAFRLGAGELWVLGCVASWVAYTLLNAWVLRDLSALAAITYACGFGTLGLGAMAFGQGMATRLPDFSALSWYGVAFLGVLGTALAFIWYAEGVVAIGPARAALFLNLVPVSAVLFGILLLGESFSPDLAIGGTLVVAGLALAARRRTASADPPPAAGFAASPAVRPG